MPYDVAFSPAVAAALTPPARSLTDGGEGELVSVLCDSPAAWVRTRVRIRVGEPAARTLAGIADSYRTVRRWVAPPLAILVIAAGVAAGRASGVVLFSMVPIALLLLSVTVLSVVLAFKAGIRRRRRSIVQYPVHAPGGYIVMRDLDPAAAEEWIGANPGLIHRID